MKTLILGGARSGKSRLAMRLAAEAERRGAQAVTVIATAQAGDEEMRRRIERHRAERPAHWHTVEAPWALADAVRGACGPGRVAIVDCLTLWLANFLAPMPGAGPAPGDFAARRTALLDAVAAAEGELLLVGNELGQGVMPVDALSRHFIDEAGWLHQALAARCERVVWVVAGCALVAKGPPLPALAATPEGP